VLRADEVDRDQVGVDVLPDLAVALPTAQHVNHQAQRRPPADKSRVAHEERGEAFQGVVVVDDLGLDRLLPGAAHRVDDGMEELFLRGEVVVEGAFGEPGGRRQVVRPRSLRVGEGFTPSAGEAKVGPPLSFGP